MIEIFPAEGGTVDRRCLPGSRSPDAKTPAMVAATLPQQFRKRVAGIAGYCYRMDAWVQHLE
ncbi:hypothetical protein G4G28_11650 [Massilia sp. Dwa41.01b]|uniref:hypothetical protein n=1 Tax=unclassified Massilia TaxID=2609279 RepID=UPI001600FC69|nr:MULTISPECIES: hypothetical protein [unclassified Massilia]QNA88975.1 hypothetical protein G4G28_11650 [Massilia sp. Dwa41.01b]QNA99866.1 hypothetical protein G4G31_15285 [Massilia sp. Se16.2.3]